MRGKNWTDRKHFTRFLLAKVVTTFLVDNAGGDYCTECTTCRVDITLYRLQFTSDLTGWVRPSCLCLTANRWLLTISQSFPSQNFKIIFQLTSILPAWLAIQSMCAVPESSLKHLTLFWSAFLPIVLLISDHQIDGNGMQN